MLYGKNIQPLCEYCEHGVALAGGTGILCPKKGVVPSGYRCRAFRYDPLKREPHPRPALPQYDASDFSLD